MAKLWSEIRRTSAMKKLVFGILFAAVVAFAASAYIPAKAIVPYADEEDTYLSVVSSSYLFLNNCCYYIFTVWKTL